MPLAPWVPDLDALQLLESVGQLGSFGQAAKAHGISQPAVSGRVRHLERRLGLPLVERTTLGCRLTAEGAVVVDWARSVLAAAEQLEAGLAALRRSRDARLRVAASLTVAEYLVPGWLLGFARERPSAEVSLAVGNSVEVERQVLAGEADLGFIEAPEVPASLDSEPIGADELTIVVAPEHHWARRGSAIEIGELAATPLVQREVGSGTRDTYDRALARLGWEAADPTVVLSSTTAIKQAVRHGVGPAVLSSLAVADDLAAGSLVQIPHTGLDLRRTLVAVWPHGRQLVGAARALVTTVHALGDGQEPTAT